MRLLILARAAIRLMRAPPKPFSVNSFMAASRIAALVRWGSRVARAFFASVPALPEAFGATDGSFFPARAAETFADLFFCAFRGSAERPKSLMNSPFAVARRIAAVCPSDQL